MSTGERFTQFKNLAWLDKFLSPFLDQQRPKSEKIIFYLRLYTYLVNAFNYFSAEQYKKALMHLEKAKKFSSECMFKEEEIYAGRIGVIASSIIPEFSGHSSKPKEISDYRIKTNLKTAQGICILRMLSAKG